MKMKSKKLARALSAGAALLVASVIAAPPAFAQATLNVSQLTGLSDGQVITISGSGFTPNLASIAIGQCVEGASGPSECNTVGGASFKPTDANGNVAEFTIVVKEKFGAYDCTTQQCTIGAQPLPGAEAADVVAANTVYHDISFGEVAPDPEPAPEPAPAPAPPADNGGTAGDELPKTGPGEELLMAAAGGALLMGLGGFALWLLPRRQGGVV